jgi:L-lysine 6-oxidase
MAKWNRRDFLTVTTIAGVAATRISADAQPRKGKPGKARYQIHPAVGVARLGNSPDSFYLEPETIGGLPLEPDGRSPVTRFKDVKGRIRRQAARFRVYVFDDADPADPGREITSGDVASMQWTVHLANKKAVWYNNDELVGNMTLGAQSQYYPPDSWRNIDVPPARRQKELIIDPGPRTVSRPGERKEFSRGSDPGSAYPHFSFPPITKDDPRAPYEVNTLGEVRMGANGECLVFGGFGHAGGTQAIGTYTGANSWYDDTSDGPVRCKLTLKSGEVHELTAWALIGSPKYAPELVNIVTLDDLMFDVGVRFQNMLPALFSNGAFNQNYFANYERDILPIIERPADYPWVANLPSMIPFTALRFDPKDRGEANRKNREAYFSYFRDPGENELSPGNQQLWAGKVPAMPLNSGTNSVTNTQISKWMPLTITQYFLLGQWVKGKFTAGKPAEGIKGVHPLDRASAGNCNGSPMSPGIEVTWTSRNAVIYDPPFRIRHYKDEAYYKANGLSTTRDETYANGDPNWTPGMEPGDFTKRMSSPWMADFYQCSIEYINFSNDDVNELDRSGIPPAPTYYAYWWPPQAPMYVITGEMTEQEQMAAGVPAGLSVYYSRGANNINNLVIAWAYMGFVVNVNDRPERKTFPYFVEKERNHDKFVAAAVAVGHPVNQLSAQGSYNYPTNYFVPMWYLKEEGEVAQCNGIPDCNNADER